jgi:hypothetical protein
MIPGRIVSFEKRSAASTASFLLNLNFDPDVLQADRVQIHSLSARVQNQFVVRRSTSLWAFTALEFLFKAA